MQKYVKVAVRIKIKIVSCIIEVVLPMEKCLKAYDENDAMTDEVRHCEPAGVAIQGLVFEVHI